MPTVQLSLIPVFDAAAPSRITNRESKALAEKPHKPRRITKAEAPVILAEIAAHCAPDTK